MTDERQELSSSYNRGTAPDDEPELNDLERLMERYGDQVLRVAFLYLKDRHRAEDAFQEVFLRVYRNRALFRRDSSVRTWIMSITVNVCKDVLKSVWWRRILPLGTNNEAYDWHAADEMAASEEKESLLRHVMELRGPYKDVVLLYYYQELSTAEIGAVLGLPEGTVRNRLHRAREQLKRKLDGWRKQYGSL